MDGVEGVVVVVVMMSEGGGKVEVEGSRVVVMGGKVEGEVVREGSWERGAVE